MLGRRFPHSSVPVKNMDMNVTYKGKTYGICDERQIDFMLEEYRKKLMLETPPKGKYYQYTEEQLKEMDDKVAAYKINCGYATLSYVLSLMTPAERKEWQAKYRFEAVSRKK